MHQHEQAQHRKRTARSVRDALDVNMPSGISAAVPWRLRNNIQERLFENCPESERALNGLHAADASVTHKCAGYLSSTTRYVVVVLNRIAMSPSVHGKIPKSAKQLQNFTVLPQSRDRD
jgi:hypothetical protein